MVFHDRPTISPTKLTRSLSPPRTLRLAFNVKSEGLFALGLDRHSTPGEFVLEYPIPESVQYWRAQRFASFLIFCIIKFLKSSRFEAVKFLILTNTLSERADSVNTLELVHIFRDHMGADCAVAISSRFTPNESRVRQLMALDVPLHVYKGKADLERFAKFERTTHTIAYSGGAKHALDYASESGGFRVNDNFHITQVIFRSNDTHGELYLYISRWLMLSSQRMRASSSPETLVDYLPLSLDPKPIFGELPKSLTDKLSNRKVVSRIGAVEQFNDRAAQKGIETFLDSNPQSVFLAVNTRNFSNHPQIIYSPTLERSEVWAAIRSSDAVINGRRMGESFGYSVFEPLSLGKPVIAPHWIRNPLMDKNHVVALGPHNLLFKTKYEVASKLTELVNSDWSIPESLRLIVEESNRSTVANKLSTLIEKAENGTGI